MQQYIDVFPVTLDLETLTPEQIRGIPIVGIRDKILAMDSFHEDDYLKFTDDLAEIKVSKEVGDKIQSSTWEFSLTRDEAVTLLHYFSLVKAQIFDSEGDVDINIYMRPGFKPAPKVESDEE